MYKEPVVIENQKTYQQFNFKTEKPIEFDIKQRESIAMHGVKS